jgi:membrane-associated phospholipid phosphatase
MRTLVTIPALVLAAMMLSAAAPQAPVCDLEAPDAAKAGAGCARAWIDRNLKLNDLVAIGTHNSYKTGVPSQVLRAMGSSAAGLDYAHRPLVEQLDAGARQIELDIYYDPQGARFGDPAGLRAAGIPLDAARRAALAEPGFKVMHMPDVDVLSSCATLRGCLGIIRRWSLDHPDHTPILLMFNAKTDRSHVPGGVDALPFDTAAFDALDAEIRSVLPHGAMVTPDDVQGRYPTLRDAVLHDNWPTLGQSRGKLLFALDEGPDKVAAYRGPRHSLEGRVFFVNTDEASPAAAYLTLNDPIADRERIRRAVEAGFIVRTRADANTEEARANSTARRDAALASGAQYVSTDYLWPDTRFPGGYQVRLSQGAAARCNPVRAAKSCGGLAVDSVSPQTPSAYVGAAEAPDGLSILPPPPASGSGRAEADRRIFAETRALRGSPRWAVAQADVTSDTYEHFACALGVQLTASRAPALTRLLDRAGNGGLVAEVKAYYATPRPYLANDLPICQDRTAHLAGNGDYPSGHASGGWLEALILAELVPDRATQILARGRAFGESRAVCGAHSASAVQAGFMAGSVAVAMLHSRPEFRADLEAARTELATVRSSAPAADPALCRAERRALSLPAY